MRRGLKRLRKMLARLSIEKASMFRRDTAAEAEFRMAARTWLEANLPVALRGRTTRPPPAELMPWYHTLSRKGWIAPSEDIDVFQTKAYGWRVNADRDRRAREARLAGTSRPGGAQSRWTNSQAWWKRSPSR